MTRSEENDRHGSASGDLGRRAAHRRDELGLSVEEVAHRSGMAPGYITYLEEHPPNLSRWSLARLARALETAPETLLGADTSVPPGHSATFGRAPWIQRLDFADCMNLIRPGGVGRIAFATQPAAGPTVLPVNFVTVEDTIVFRTTVDGIISRHATGEVSFQVDRLDGAMSEGWSVLVMGGAHIVRDSNELDTLTSVPVRPWAGGDRETVVRITPTAVSGRRVHAGGEAQ